MNKEKWGVKRVCLSCSTRFYDFNLSPIICPQCGEEFDPDYLRKKKSRTSQDKTDIVDDLEVVKLIEGEDDDDMVDDDDIKDENEDDPSLDDEEV